MTDNQQKKWDIFLATVFFVLGFSVIFSLVGVLLQSVLANVSVTIQDWLARIGGIIIIFFGLYLLGFINPKFLQKEHKFAVKRKFKSIYLTSFIFGAAFAVGWTPCVSVALGAILALAASQPSSAFVLLMAYTLGIGIPFLTVGLFVNQAQRFIDKISKYLIYTNYIFGIILVLLGILVFVNQLNRVANSEILTNILINLDVTTVAGSEIMSFSFINIGIAFLAGIISFLSPCILPLLPGFLSYLGTVSTRK